MTTLGVCSMLYPLFGFFKTTFTPYPLGHNFDETSDNYPLVTLYQYNLCGYACLNNLIMCSKKCFFIATFTNLFINFHILYGKIYLEVLKKIIIMSFCCGFLLWMSLGSGEKPMTIKASWVILLKMASFYLPDSW